MSAYRQLQEPDATRRQLLRGALGGASLGIARRLGLPLLFSQAALASAADERNSNRILVVFELSGGNDGLNTVVPYADDAYYRQRPQIGIRPNKVRKIDDRFGFSPGMAGILCSHPVGAMEVASDVSGGNAECPSCCDKNMGDVLADASPKRKGFRGSGGSVSRIGIKSNFTIERL